MEQEKVIPYEDKRFFTVLEFYELTGRAVTKTQIYRMCNEGQIPHKKLGAKVLLNGNWVRDFLNDSYAGQQT
jgi:hypothetical protein